jgi:anthranilate phosphoribosyltransferase
LINASVRKLVEGSDLERSEMHDVFASMMDGHSNDIQKSALLVALKMKGETVDEITGAAEAMRERVVPLGIDADELVDTCGTGGDGKGTFNISTLAAFVAAGAGVRVAKHGNRAVSSSCGSADLLSELGVKIDAEPERMTDALRANGVSFLFAPKMHPAMAAVVPVRRELGVRTIFNVLGPLTNPAFAKRQVLGVYSPRLVELVAHVLRALGSEHALVVHSSDGLDEISVSSSTHVAELRNGKITTYELTPEDLGLQRYSSDDVLGGDAKTNAGIAMEIFERKNGARRAIVLANAAAAIYVSGRAGSIREAIALAAESIDSGAALEKLQGLVRASNA